MKDSIELLEIENYSIEDIKDALKAIDHSLTKENKTVFSMINKSSLKMAFSDLGSFDRPFIIIHKQVLLDLMEIDGLFLQYASDLLKDDNEVAVFMVKNCPYAIEYTSERIQEVIKNYKNKLLEKELMKLSGSLFDNIETILG